MSRAAQLALMAMVGMVSGPKIEQTQIRSYEIEQKRVEEQPSKRVLQRIKGKGVRKNRGKNR